MTYPPSIRHVNPAPGHPASGLAPIVRSAARLSRRTDRIRIGRLLGIGIALSLLLHITIMIWLATVYRMRAEVGSPTPVSFDFTVLPDSALSELDAVDLSDLASEVGDALDQAATPDDLSAELTDSTALEIDLSVGSLPVLGGAGGASGSGEGFGSGAGGGGASFFGLTARGTRFAYIVDISGSMEMGDRMPVMVEELCQSVLRLPDNAHFYLVFFASGYSTPPMQRGWQLARRPTTHRFARWIRSDIVPGGGTYPRESFEHVFELSIRPDAIFFLTDGEIPGGTADAVAAMNTGRRRVAIHTIAFGDASSQDELRRMARDSGGTYRYVPTTH